MHIQAVLLTLAATLAIAIPAAAEAKACKAYRADLKEAEKGVIKHMKRLEAYRVKHPKPWTKDIAMEEAILKSVVAREQKGVDAAKAGLKREKC